MKTVELVEICHHYMDQDNEFDNYKLTNLDSITVNRTPNSENELANKKYIDDSIVEDTLVRLIQTFQNYLKVSLENDDYNLAKYDEIQSTDTTKIKYRTSGGYSLQHWNIKCNDTINNGKKPNFIKSTETSSPTSHSRAISLPPTGDSFLYEEIGSGNNGNRMFVSFERTDIIQISNIAFLYNRYSFLTNGSLKSMGRFGI